MFSEKSYGKMWKIQKVLLQLRCTFSQTDM